MKSDNRKISSQLQRLIFPFANVKNPPFLQISTIITQRRENILSKTKFLLKNTSMNESNQEKCIKKNTVIMDDDREKHSRLLTNKSKRGAINDVLKKKINLKSNNSSLPLNKLTPKYNHLISSNRKDTTSLNNGFLLYNNNISRSTKDINITKNDSNFFMTHFDNVSSLTNKPLTKTNSSFNLNSIERSNSQNSFLSSSLQSKCKFIRDTVKKSIKESNLFNRKLNCYMNQQRKHQRSLSFTKTKSIKELELEGKYEEMKEPIRFLSKSFKKAYCPYKNIKTGDSFIIRQGYAELMKYIDNYARMEDSLSFNYKQYIYKMYPIIQEAADLRIIDEDDEEIRRKKSIREEKMNNSLKRVKDLTMSLKLKKNVLFNQIDEANEKNKHDKLNAIKIKRGSFKRIKNAASDK